MNTFDEITKVSATLPPNGHPVWDYGHKAVEYFMTHQDRMTRMHRASIIPLGSVCIRPTPWYSRLWPFLLGPRSS